MILKNRITRTIAFLLSCLLVGIAAFNCAEALVKYCKDNDDSRQHIHFLYSDDDPDAFKLYTDLWIVGTMYLRNLDENGRFTGTPELKKQTEAFLKMRGLMDDSGRLTINDSMNGNFLVKWGENSLSNSKKTVEDYKNETAFLFSHGSCQKNIDNWNGHVYMPEVRWIKTNYGMTYYYINGVGVALFDFETDGLKSYVDELGATMYYKTDGSMPLPAKHYVEDEEFDYDNAVVNDLTDDELDALLGLTDEELADTTVEMDENGVIPSHWNVDITQRVPVTTAAAEKPFIPVVPNESGYLYYDESRGVYVPVFEDNFIKETGSVDELTIAIQPDLDALAAMEKERAQREDNMKVFLRDAMNNLPLVIIALILALYVIVMGGYDTKEKKFVLSDGDRIFAEFPAAVILFGLMALIITIEADDEIFVRVMRFCEEMYTVDYTYWIYGTVFGAFFGVMVLMVDTLLVRMKCRSLWKTSIIGRIFGLLGKLLRKLKELNRRSREMHLLNTRDREMMRNDKATRNYIVRVVMFITLEIFAFICSLGFESMFPLIMGTFVLTVGSIITALLDLRDVNRLYSHISDMYSGNYEKKNVSRESVAYVPTEKLNSISDGIQAAVERQVKSERMKIDLVTNVSHDLKTPLTSIISYIDLLSAEELSPAARDYVTIIDNKSQRLKTMVADLFDLAKATSRTDINAEELDAVILTEQVLADLADKIEASGREIRTDIQADSAPVMAEGKKLYRVFQNLIDNALKYSMIGTRIYVALKNESGNCVITVKNISSYEMTFSPDEIMERFTRGDESRSTEGNGLGLSIAKSFTEACGGTFGVSIDGDVFIAKLSLPIIQKSE